MDQRQLERNTDLYIDLIKKTLTASIYDESTWSVIELGTRELRSLKRPLKLVRGLLIDLLVVALQKKSIFLTRENPSTATDDGKNWPLFAYTMVGHKRLDNVQACIEDVIKNEVPGDFIETGVWRGGTTIFMRALLNAYGIKDRKVWVADSFEGLPVPKSEDDGWDRSQVQFLKVSFEKVKSNFAKFGLLDEQVEFLKGWFCDTLPNAPIQKLAILRLDGDMYSSTMDSLQSLYHKVSKGGYIIVDDYYSWPACRAAITDFLKKNSLNPEIKAIDWTGAYWKCE